MQSYQSLLARQRSFFATHRTKDPAFRLDALRKLRKAISDNEQAITEALRADLYKSAFESYTTEIGVVLKELGFISKHLMRWTRPEKVKTPLTHFGARSYIHSEPYGVSLIIAPWNYPFQLAMTPLVGAIAAGNCAVVKPSELTPNTAEVVARLIGNIFPEEYIAVIKGGADTSQALLDMKFDYIFFTGSVAVGKEIMKKAAAHLTPLTLELGGKSPCIVHDDADVKLAAKRIAWGKFMNAGQTCIAPDYLYVHHNIRTKFLQCLEASITELFGNNPIGSKTFTRIVNDAHFDRLCTYLDSSKVCIGGKSDKNTLMIEPTVLGSITWDDKIMEDEIFGPLLPILDYQNLDEVIEEINKRPKPLALYLFSESERLQQRVMTEVSFGGSCINDTLYHFASEYLPFGGVGNSGMGSYHGRSSFDTFSHRKSVLKQTTLFDLPFRYPQENKGMKLLRFLLR